MSDSCFWCILEEEQVLSGLPHNALPSPAPSHVVMVTQPQTPAQPEMMTVQQDTSQATFQLSPQPAFQGQQVRKQFKVNSILVRSVDLAVMTSFVVQKV